MQWCQAVGVRQELFPAASNSSGSLTSKFEFSELPSPSTAPRFSGQALILWVSGWTAPQAWRSCLQVWFHYIHKPFHSPGLCPHLMVYPLHKNWGFYVFISWQMQASHHVICCRCCTQVSRWHISNSKQKNKGVSAFRTITRSRENLQCYCCISAFPLVEENYSL